MRRLLPLLLVPALLSACALLGAARGADTCRTIPGERVAEALGTTLVKQELDGQHEYRRETVSTCHYDLANGDYVRITLHSYADNAAADTELEWLKKQTPVTTLSAKLGFPVFYKTGEKEIDALPGPTEHAYARIGHNAGQAQLDKTVVAGNVAVATFKHTGPENPAEKLAAVIALTGP